MSFLKKPTFENYLKKLSLLIIIFPYLIFLLINSSLNFELFFVALILFLLDIFFLNKVKNRFLIILILSSIIVFFYSKIFFNDTEIIVHQLRFREFLLIFGIISTLIVSFLTLLENGLKVINIFFFVFGVTFLANKDSNKYYNREKILSENQFKFEKKLVNNKKSNLPLIFIIFDELSSSKEIFNETQDSLDIIHDQILKKNGFQVFNEFKSKSIHTKFSMPSIFNFNLHEYSTLLDSIEKIQDEVTIQKSYYWIASNNLLIDSLNKKGIKSHSYGLFPFKNGIIDEKFIYWWPSFLDPLRIFGNDNFFQKFFQETLLKNVESVFLDITTVESFKLNVFEKLKNLKPKKNSFYYFHFFAPHEPFTWNKEYSQIFDLNTELSPDQELLEHIKFRRFILNKTLPIITAEKFKNCRIIISGDHGFRFNKEKIKPNLTNLYLYNFSKINDMEKISVQDLGYLIYNSF